MKKALKNKIEIICWYFEEKPKKSRTEPTERMLRVTKCVAGFVIKEDEKKLEISSTKATCGFIDTVKIKKSSIVSRGEMLAKQK